MKVIVQAIKRTDIYEVVQDGWFNNQPRLKKDCDNSLEEVVVIKELDVVENHILLNTYNYDDVLITDYEGEKVDGEFRIQYDLEEDIVYLKSDVIVELLEPNKEEMEKELEIKLKVWNKETIEKNEKLNAYCELHGLDKETVDISQLKRLVPQYATGGVLPYSNTACSFNIDEFANALNNINRTTKSIAKF